MSSLFKKALELIVGESDDGAITLRMPKKHLFRKFSERELIQLESEIGATLFGPIPHGHRREFFCLDENTWIWYEEGPNPTTGAHEEVTTRYEVHDNGILKVQDGSRYTFIEGAELDNLVVATRMYYEQVARGIYKRDPQTGNMIS
ncbi:MAG TPA: hypothetical protein VFM68_04370 [Candidatus Saccharimonadales bacterium]|nr:hypothetical protein [Candidatus Saccharimonadales bacterium]